ncbi:MAG: hypothetical protein IPO27_08910 [Bacteroidetes bacterium]|nr:hypothetical protein [Bacteroidota bacterium]
MSKAKQRFEIQLAKIKPIMLQAKSKRNPGQWLSTNNARTPLFNLEALSKMYGDVYNSKDFSKIEKQAKEIEDALGDVDHYVVQSKQINTNTKIPKAAKEYFRSKTNEANNRLNQLLLEENWLNGKRIAKMELRIGRAKWMEDVDEVSTICDYYIKEIKEIEQFVAQTSCNFTNMEDHVHELRRKIRWLSIYPQALNGLAKLVDRKTTPKYFEKYMVKEIINSPFNKLTPDAALTHHIQFYKENYLALSWMIAELGKIKDAGLGLFAIAEALVATESCTHEEAEIKALHLLGKKQKSTLALLEDASVICQEYFSKKLLTNLLVK